MKSLWGIFLVPLFACGGVIQTQATLQNNGDLQLQSVGELFATQITPEELRLRLRQSFPDALISECGVIDTQSWRIALRIPGWADSEAGVIAVQFPRAATIWPEEKFLEENIAIRIPAEWRIRPLPDTPFPDNRFVSGSRRLQWERPILTEKTTVKRSDDYLAALGKPSTAFQASQGSVAAALRSGALFDPRNEAPAHSAQTTALTALDSGAFEWRQGDEVKQQYFAAASWTPVGVGDKLVVSLPRNLLLRASAPPRGVKPTLRPENNRMIYEWTATEEFDFNAYDSETRPALAVSSLSWDDVANKLHNMLLPLIEEQPQTIAQARELAETVANDYDKVRVLREYLHKQFTVLQQKTTEPLPALDALWERETLYTQEYTLLLFAMLEAVGADVELVAVSGYAASAMPDLWWEFPQWIFDDLIIRVNVPEGEPGEFYVGNDGLYAPLGYTRFNDRAALELNGTGTLFAIQVPEELQDRRESFVRLELEATGGARLHVRERFHGGEYVKRLEAHHSESTDERTRRFQRRIAEITPDAEIVQPLVSSFSAYPAEESFVIDLPAWQTIQDGATYFPLPELNFGLPPIIPAAMTQAYWNWPMRTSRQIHYQITLPPLAKSTWSVLPSAFTWNIPLPECAATLQVDLAAPDRVEIFASLETIPGRISKVDFPSMHTGEAAIRRAEHATVVLTNAASAK